MSIVSPERLAADKARLAQLEAEFKVNPGASFVRQNLESYRKRVANNRLTAPTATPAPIVTTPAATPAAKPVAVPVRPAATREEKLRRLAAFLGGTAEELATAIKDGVSPDDFALILSDGTAAERLAAQIVRDGMKPDQRTPLLPDATAADRLAANIVKDAGLAKASAS